METPETRERMDEAQAWLAAIVDCSDDAIIGKTLDGIVTSWNSGAERMYGYSADEIVGKSISLLLPPHRQGELADILDRVGRGERIDHYETVRIHKDGREMTISATVSPVKVSDGVIVGASTIARDITVQKRIEAGLREKEEEYRGIFEATTDGLVVTDLDSILAEVNPAFCRMHGSVVNEAVDSTTPDTAFRWDSTDHQWIFNISTKNLIAGTTYYYEIVLNDGTKINFNFATR